MSAVDVWLLLMAGVLVVAAGLFSSADAALSSFSKARAEEQTRRKKDEAEAARTEDDGPTTATSNDRRVQVEFNGKDLGRIDITNAAELQRTAKALLPHIIDEIKRAARATGAFGR